MQLERIGPNRYRLPRSGKMRVNGLVYASEALLPHVRSDKSLEQLAHAACLPGVVEPVLGMPDIHEGFGLPIGGVMAVEEGGVISAGAVGFDINCGVRLLRTNLRADDFDKPLLRRLMVAIEDLVPTGSGKTGLHRGVTQEIFTEVLHHGVQAVIAAGFGRPEDSEHIEENGCLQGADASKVSAQALKRGSGQLGTLGGGNHFIEIQRVDEIFDPQVAAEFGLFAGQLTVMAHTGSRGIGHQIATDYSASHIPAATRYGIELPSKGLACAPIDSPEGKAYFAAMACAVNFAFSNRQFITADVRQAFASVLQRDPREMGFEIVYDVAHNIAKWEVHGGRRLLVHRKGATRALPPGHPANPPAYRKTGHPALVPGSMGTASYVVVGTELAAESFFSVNHGAGRALSRSAAEKAITREQFEAGMGEVLYNTRDFRDVLDEAPQAYKDIDEVVETLVAIGLTRKVARMRPLAVIKGKD
ncbi:MAG: RtcB family protein [Syntrophomonadaceae bacterium]|nr:RtcB family protein [Syntrophomonadaceae bacterium]